MKTRVVDELTCPRCGRPELNPDIPDTLFLRGFKVYDKFGGWSECLVCDIWFTESGRIQKGRTPKADRVYTTDGKLKQLAH